MITAEQERRVERELDILIPRYLVGYQYLKNAILLAIDYNRIDLKNEIYPKVAKTYGVKVVSLEKRIKITLEDAYYKNEKAFKVFFGEPNYLKCLTPARFIKAFVKKMSA